VTSATRRLAAFAFDYVLIAGYITAVSIVSYAIWHAALGRMPGPADASLWLFDLLAFTTVVVPVTLYFALSEASGHRATWGKRRVGLVVLSSDGTRLGLGRSVLRSALKFLPWQIAHSSLFHIPGWPMAVETIPAVAAAGLAISGAIVALYLADLLLSRGRWTPYDRIAQCQVRLGFSEALS
jgi:uncharacterized RDD family membrane protein YckC